jgi:hypothetical protein
MCLPCPQPEPSPPGSLAPFQLFLVVQLPEENGHLNTEKLESSENGLVQVSREKEIKSLDNIWELSNKKLKSKTVSLVRISSLRVTYETTMK